MSALPNLMDLAEETLVLSKSRYASARDRSPAWVSYMIKAGRLTAPALREDGRIDVEAADKMLRERCDPFRGARKPFPTENPTPERRYEPPVRPREIAGLFADDTDKVVEINVYRTRRERADAELKELQLARQRGEMVAVAELRRAAAELAGVLRQALSDRMEDLTAQVRDAATLEDAEALIAASDRALCAKLAAAARGLAEASPDA